MPMPFRSCKTDPLSSIVSSLRTTKSAFFPLMHRISFQLQKVSLKIFPASARRIKFNRFPASRHSCPAWAEYSTGQRIFRADLFINRYVSFSYAAAFFFGNTKSMKPTPRQMAHITPPIPIVIPRPVIIHTGTRPANASFQHITAL